MRKEEDLLDELPPSQKADLCRQHAELTSKDPELSANSRHDIAIKILGEMFDLDAPSLDGDAETFGIAGGICKRRWMDLGQYEDLQRAAEYYRRAAQGASEMTVMRTSTRPLCRICGPMHRARQLRPGSRPDSRESSRGAAGCGSRITISNGGMPRRRAEALFGLGRYAEAAAAIKAAPKRPETWRLQATAQQLATLAQLREKRPLQNAEIRAVFEALLPGAAQAASSVVIGKVGLALSGGGFRASFYHLGVLARLAELDVLRHVDVLSCVSGGSIVGACYWLMLRNRLPQGRAYDAGRLYFIGGGSYRSL